MTELDALDPVASAASRWSHHPVDIADVLCDRHVGDGSAVALQWGSGTQSSHTTYADLQRRSTTFAVGLAALGVEGGSRVALRLPPSPTLLGVLIALWRLGAVPVLLPAGVTASVSAYLYGHCDAQLLLSDLAGAHQLGDVVAPVVVVGRRDLGGIRSPAVAAPMTGAFVAPELPIAVVFTRGTVAAPSGVAVPVKALAAIESFLRFALDGDTEAVLWNAFDPAAPYGLTTALGVLLLGGTVLWPGSAIDGHGAARFVREQRVSHVTGPPSLYASLRECDAAPEAMSTVRVMVSTGAAIDATLKAWIAERFGVRIHDQYTLTEVGTLIAEAGTGAPAPSPVGTIGQPLPGFRATVLVGLDQEAKPGEAGEIAIDIPASPLFWFDGYVGDNRRTRERFSPDGRFFLTGDSGRCDVEGGFVLL